MKTILLSCLLLFAQIAYGQNLLKTGTVQLLGTGTTTLTGSNGRAYSGGTALLTATDSIPLAAIAQTATSAQTATLATIAQTATSAQTAALATLSTTSTNALRLSGSISINNTFYFTGTNGTSYSANVLPTNTFLSGAANLVLGGTGGLIVLSGTPVVQSGTALTFSKKTNEFVGTGGTMALSGTINATTVSFPSGSTYFAPSDSAINGVHFVADGDGGMLLDGGGFHVTGGLIIGGSASLAGGLLLVNGSTGVVTGDLSGGYNVHAATLAPGDHPSTDFVLANSGSANNVTLTGATTLHDTLDVSDANLSATLTGPSDLNGNINGDGGGQRDELFYNYDTSLWTFGKTTGSNSYSGIAITSFTLNGFEQITSVSGTSPIMLAADGDASALTFGSVNATTVSAGIPEVWTITTTSSPVNSTYIAFSVAGFGDFYVWFNDGGGTDPHPNGGPGLAIGDSSAQGIYDAISAAIAPYETFNGLVGGMVLSVDVYSFTVTLTCVNPGPQTDISTGGGTGCTVAVAQQGELYGSFTSSGITGPGTGLTGTGAAFTSGAALAWQPATVTNNASNYTIAFSGGNSVTLSGTAIKTIVNSAPGLAAAFTSGTLTLSGTATNPSYVAGLAGSSTNQVLSTPAITSGTLGGTTAATGTFSRLVTSGSLSVSGTGQVGPNGYPYVDLTGTANLDFPSTAVNTANTLFIAVANAAAGDTITLGLPITSSTLLGCVFRSGVIATGTVAITLGNNMTLNAVDPPADTFRVDVKHHQANGL